MYTEYCFLQTFTGIERWDSAGYEYKLQNMAYEDYYLRSKAQTLYYVADTFF